MGNKLSPHRKLIMGLVALCVAAIGFVGEPWLAVFSGGVAVSFFGFHFLLTKTAKRHWAATMAAAGGLVLAMFGYVLGSQPVLPVIPTVLATPSMAAPSVTHPSTDTLSPTPAPTTPAANGTEQTAPLETGMHVPGDVPASDPQAPVGPQQPPVPKVTPTSPPSQTPKPETPPQTEKPADPETPPQPETPVEPDPVIPSDPVEPQPADPSPSD